jgi:hypothetical protein
MWCYISYSTRIVVLKFCIYMACPLKYIKVRVWVAFRITSRVWEDFVTCAYSRVHRLCEVNEALGLGDTFLLYVAYLLTNKYV